MKQLGKKDKCAIGFGMLLILVIIAFGISDRYNSQFHDSGEVKELRFSKDGGFYNDSICIEIEIPLEWRNNNLQVFYTLVFHPQINWTF